MSPAKSFQPNKIVEWLRIEDEEKRGWRVEHVKDFGLMCWKLKPKSRIKTHLHPTPFIKCDRHCCQCKHFRYFYKLLLFSKSFGLRISRIKREFYIFCSTADDATFQEKSAYQFKITRIFLKRIEHYGEECFLGDRWHFFSLKYGEYFCWGYIAIHSFPRYRWCWRPRTKALSCLVLGDICWQKGAFSTRYGAQASKYCNRN